MRPAPDAPALPPLPYAPIQRLTHPFQRFLAVEAASGFVLIGCTLIALLAANTAWAPGWRGFWDTRLTVEVGDLRLAYPLWYWVNDGLMALFFFVVGLEIKRELVAGELSDRRKVTLPVAAAIGGAAVPALIHAVLRAGTPDARGWAVPMATDIAFVVGCLALLGPRVPRGLKVLMLSLAIVDDLLAVIVIALFYSGSLATGWMAAAALGLALVLLLNRLGVRPVPIYVLVGAFVWLATLKSGIHPTVAGAVLGLLTPATPWIAADPLRSLLGAGHRALAGPPPPPHDAEQEILGRVELAAREARSPLERLEHLLHPWVGFVIMPIFALANAGLPLADADATSAGALAVAAGLVLGKPLGFLLAAALVVRTGLARLPESVSWRAMVGAGCLAGIGFTMSLFVASLSFEGRALLDAKSGVLAGSLVSALLGMGLLLRALPCAAAQAEK